MNKNTNSNFEHLKVLVLNKIINNSDKNHPIKQSVIKEDININRRELQRILVSLREEYPIVSKEVDGGGYWIAKDKNDVADYIYMMERRKLGYQETINIMSKYLND